MIEVICNDRLGKKVRVKVNEDDTIGDLKKLIAAQVDHAERLLFIWPFLTRMPETSHRCNVVPNFAASALPSLPCHRWALDLRRSGFRSGTQFSRTT